MMLKRGLSHLPAAVSPNELHDAGQCKRNATSAARWRFQVVEILKCRPAHESPW
jgi:hypothetical protein